MTSLDSSVNWSRNLTHYIARFLLETAADE